MGLGGIWLLCFVAATGAGLRLGKWSKNVYISVPRHFFQINVDFCISSLKLYLWPSLYKHFWDFQPTLLYPRVLSIKQDHITVFSLFTLIMLIICHFQLWLCCQLGQQICKISRNPLLAKTISVVFQSVPTALGMLLEAIEVLLSVGQNYVCRGVWGLFCFVLFSFRPSGPSWALRLNNRQRLCQCSCTTSPLKESGNCMIKVGHLKWIAPTHGLCWQTLLLGFCLGRIEKGRKKVISVEFVI